MTTKPPKAAKPQQQQLRKVPTQDEVFAALNAAPAAASSSTSGVYALLYFFSAVTIALLAALANDPYLLRRHTVGHFRLFFLNTGRYDSLIVLFLGIVGFCFVAFALFRAQTVKLLKQTYRQTRRDLILQWKLTYRTRHRTCLLYVVLLAQLALAACAWRALLLYSRSESPMVVVLSGSMETAFYRGDILFLTNYPDDAIVPGEILVFRIDQREIPIVHRMMQVHRSDLVDRGNSTELFLTKGDNNNQHDRPLYAPGQLWLLRDQVMGRARFFVPYVGMITVKVNEYPALKLVVIVVMLALTLYTKEL